jgi:hypothetical protein
MALFGQPKMHRPSEAAQITDEARERGQKCLPASKMVTREEFRGTLSQPY